MTPDTSDITRRLRQTRADMIGTDDEQHYWDSHEAAGEIDRLRQWGRLTDTEWEAAEQVIDAANGMGQAEPWAMDAIRGLLSRLGGCDE